MMKVCIICGETKNVEDFYKTNGYVRSRCKACYSYERSNGKKTNRKNKTKMSVFEDCKKIMDKIKDV